MLSFKSIIFLAFGFALRIADGTQVNDRSDLLFDRIMTRIKDQGSKIFQPEGFSYKDEAAIMTAEPIVGSFQFVSIARSSNATMRLEDMDEFYVHIPFTFVNISTMYKVNFTFVQTPSASYHSNVRVYSTSASEGSLKLLPNSMRCQGILENMDLGQIQTTSVKLTNDKETPLSDEEELMMNTVVIKGPPVKDFPSDMQRAIFNLFGAVINDALDGFYMCDLSPVGSP